MITGPKEDGGAAITPKSGQWKCVEAIFPLHDHEGNKEFLKSMAGKTFLTPEDLDFIRNNLGEKVSSRPPINPQILIATRLVTTSRLLNPISPSLSSPPPLGSPAGCC
jgi:hypothetical protein